MELSAVSGAASSLSSVNADNAASVLVAKKALDVQKMEGAASVRLIDEAAVTGKGRLVNTYA
jgi:hypothetical protein